MEKFYDIIIFGYLLTAGILIYLFSKNKINKILKFIIILILSIGIILAIQTRFVEPYLLKINKINLEIEKINSPIKIAFIADIQAGKHKQTAWIKKIVDKIKLENPDLILLGGDLIDNEGIFIDESKFLEPLKQLGNYPIYYILGNHEYGIGSGLIEDSSRWTGDRSQDVINRMEELGIKLLKNNLECPEIHGQKICVFGADDVWKHKNIDFSALENWDLSAGRQGENLPLIFLTHNPDGIMQWPENKSQPDLTLAGHTHGGQISLPFIGPLGNPRIKLSKNYYSGLNYYNNSPVFTTVGAGESGGSLRLFNRPEIAIINLY